MIEPAFAIGPQNSFLTGSQVYGTPTDDSDTDLVILLTHEDLRLLRLVAPDKNDNASGEWYGSEGDYSFVLRGKNNKKVNLICFTDENKFLAWKKGTMILKTIAPVGRDQAIEVLDRMEKEIYERNSNQQQPQ